MRKSLHIKRPIRYDEYLYGSVSVSVEYDTEHTSDGEAYDEVNGTISAAIAEERKQIAGGSPALDKAKKQAQATKEQVQKTKPKPKPKPKPEPEPEPENPTTSGDEETASGDDTLPAATVDEVRQLISEYAGIKGDVTEAAKILQSFGYKSAGKVPEDALPKVAQAFREAIDAG
jgi:hypothetical protein